MAYYDNTSDAGIHFTSSVPEGLEAYRFPSQVPTTENASNDDIHPISSMPGEFEAYPFLGHMPATENVGDAGIYPTSSVPGELEAYPFLGQMSATENINGIVYPTSSVPGEVETYPFLSQLPATEEVDFLAGYTLANPWGMAEQPNHLASSVTTSYEPVASTSYAAHIDGYDEQLSFDDNWPAVGQHAQPHNHNFLGQDAPFSGTVLTPSSVPIDCRWLNQNDSSIGTSYVDNVHNYHQPSTGMMSTGRYHPYEVSRAPSSERRNAEAGPSTRVFRFIPYIGPPTLQPSGGTISETTADAELTPKITEEDKVPTPKRAKCHYSLLMKKGKTRLREWARLRLGLREAPSVNMALAAAVQDVQMIRPLVSQKHQLLIRHGKRTKVGWKSADAEARRRDEERELFKELSKYYPLGQGQDAWERPPLLSRALQDLEGLPPLSGSSNNPSS